MRLPCVLVVSSLAAIWCQAQPDTDGGDSALIRAVLKKGLSEALEGQPEKIVSGLLDDARVVSPAFAAVAGEKNGKVIVAYAKRVSTLLDSSQKKSLIRSFLAAEFIRHQAKKSPELQKALKPYKYGHLLYDQLAVRMLSRVQGKLFGLGENTSFFTSKTHVVGVAVLAPDQVELKVVSILGQKEIRAIYQMAIVKQLKVEIARGKYAMAKGMLLEAKKYGYPLSKGYLVNLYHCYLFTGKPDEVSRLSKILVDRHGVTLTDDDCLAFASLSLKAKQSKEAQFWNLQAQRRGGDIIDLDSLLEGFKTKNPLQNSPNQDPKKNPKGVPNRLKQPERKSD